MLFDRLLGSLKAQAWAEVRRHQATNRDFQFNRDPLHVRILRTLLFRGSFIVAVLGYIATAAVVAFGESFNDAYCRGQTCQWLTPAGLIRSDRAEDFLRDVAGFMIGAQTGLLGVLSIAVALVTLIGQRQNAGPDVRVYYHQSFAVPLAASSLALLAVLCAQLFWPLELMSPYYGVPSDNLTAEWLLTVVHALWLLGNIAVYARFILISLSFGQEEQRSRYRALYTANIVAPMDIYRAIVRAQYTMCAERLRCPKGAQADISMGYYYALPPIETVTTHLARPSVLEDIWLQPLKAAIWLWAGRVGRDPAHPATVVFLVGFERRLHGRQTLCRTAEGCEMNLLERYLVRTSFRFRRVR